MSSRPTVTCARCGAKNPLDRVFCLQCGVRLDMNLSERRLLAGGGRWGRRIIRLVEIALLALVALLLWPAKPDVETGGETDVQVMARKLQSLLDAQRAGTSQLQVLSESEVNAYLAKVVQQNEAASRAQGLRMSIGRVLLGFAPGEITACVIARWGPLRLSYEVAGRPELDDGTFRFHPQRARWGHLPAIGPVRSWVAARMAPVFMGLERERRLLDGLQRLDLGRGQVRLFVEGPSGLE